METIFGNYLQKAIQTASMEKNTEAARTWLRNKASSLRRNPMTIINASSTRAASLGSVGQMFLFSYNPKYKEELPYYDKFPLVFPIQGMSNGVLGINMHYLPLPYRAKLMDALYDTVNNDAMDSSTRLKISYEILNKASKFKYFKPCVKHYLYNHVDSRVIYIDAKEWDVALFLPLQRFQKASTASVYRDSRKLITKG
jgi:hypothetical protein